MRVSIDKELKGKDLFSYLVKNKKDLINTKKSMPFHSEGCVAPCRTKNTTKLTSFKGNGTSEDPNVLPVKVVQNMAMFADSYLDVLSPNSWDKTISENGPKGKNIIAHLHDHKHEVMARIGTTKEIYSEVVNLSDIGVISHVLQGTALIMESDVRKDYNAKAFNQYKNGDINQHSIGLRYRKIQLAVNDDDFKDEYAIWTKNFNGIINPKTVLEEGYFWYVSEIELFENSAVLHGANELTPTLSTGFKSEDQPSNDTIKEPSNDTQSTKDEEEDKIKPSINLQLI